MNNINWKYEKRDIGWLIDNVDNPRRLSKKTAEDLTNSIGKFGLCQPIVAQPDGSIIGGHQRLKMLKSLGHKSIFVAIPSRELSTREFKELTIGLNKIKGDFDFDILANRWEPELLMSSGFTDEELHTDVIPKEKTKKFTINIKFDSEEDLRAVENVIQKAVDLFPSAVLKIRCK